MKGLPTGAVFVYSGATASLIRTFTSSSTNGPIGIAIASTGDVDGDGAKELLITDTLASNVAVNLFSGKTGVRIRQHKSSESGFGNVLDHAGDVDADGVEDYVVATTGTAYVYSGANGKLLWTIAAPHRFGKHDLGLVVVSGAGDVNLDGHADVLVANPNYQDPEGLPNGEVLVVSGATGKTLFTIDGILDNLGETLSESGDVDGDGHPDVVAGTSGVVSGDAIWLVSGATGGSIRRFGDSAPLALDATRDLSGDSLPDALYGDVDFGDYTNPYDDKDDVAVSSLLDGSNAFIVSQYDYAANCGSSCTIVDDRDGDGFRDVAVAFPGGSTTPRSGLVAIHSGADGHELSRISSTTTDPFGSAVVKVGDVDGDGVSDLAIGAPYRTINGLYASGQVEIHSGHDDSLITTLSSPNPQSYHYFGSSLASAIDSNGVVLLAVGEPGHEGAVRVFDLTHGSVSVSVVGFDYDGALGTTVACAGDVDADGIVDWSTNDSTGVGPQWMVFSGNGGATIWEKSAIVDKVVDAGDLDADGIGDLLGSDLGHGTVTARSGVDGRSIFVVSNPDFFGDSFGISLCSLGDVNRDGIADFAVGASERPAGNFAHAGSVFVYSGRTTGLLYRFDGDPSTGPSFDPRSSHFGDALPNLALGDDAKLTATSLPSLIVGSPRASTIEYQAGRAQLFQLDDLFLQVDPTSPAVGQTATAYTRGGPGGALAGLYALDLSGTPLDYFLALGTFDTSGIFAVSDTVPSSLQGETLTMISYGVGFDGKLVDTQEVAVAFQ